MATLYITEFQSLSYDNAGREILAPMSPGPTEQNVRIGEASTVSRPFAPATKFIMVNADYTCSLAFGEKAEDKPVASTDYHRLPAGETRFYGVRGGTSLAVIANN